ncbi:MAG TPA: T9SS type A sorting domain-containing protein, partial [Ignavibacteria bacterium]|nr:T9SS type A sorting domain-containing protein [Ignavibacteria bacterium]
GYTTVNGAQNNTDVMLMKLNTNGSVNWVKKYNEGSGISTDKAFGIVVDSDNRIYVSGEASNSSQGKNYLTLKYNTSGNLQWSSVYDGPGHGDDYANAISLLSSSRIVVTGASWGVNQNFDYATLKIKKNDGGVQSVSRYSLTGSSNDIAKDIDVSNSNTIYVTGYSELIVDNKGSGAAITTLMEKDNDEETNTGNNIPEKFLLLQNYPNPFNPSTTIKFEISDNMPVKLVVYDMLGRSVDKLVDSELKAGSYSIVYTNKNLSSGIYFYELSAGNYKDVKKMTVVK